MEWAVADFSSGLDAGPQIIVRWRADPGGKTGSLWADFTACDIHLAELQGD
jgi:hypothetical protein